MKRKILAMVIVILIMTPLLGCEDRIETSKEKGVKASEEFCECLNNKNSLTHCEDKLNESYGYYSNNDDFIKAFNDANDCDVTISKKTK
ncbi:MAG: hypothetical protein LBP83_02440 [Dysgonamonadaceae bacterium]|jgi:hypothetical protein|nr:hypothetical protein [Dysgonamonadaceae bacterium]